MSEKISAKKRKQRKEISKIHCFVEGSQTELNYINAWKNKVKNKAIIATHAGHTDPKGIVQAAIKQRKQLKNKNLDQFWAIFDTEAPQDLTRQQQINNALPLAKKNSIQLAISNPCFEFWLLLHFTNHTAPFQNQTQATTALKTHLPNYQKNATPDPSLFQKNTVETAIQRAKDILQNHITNSTNQNQAPHTYNPSTGMHELVNQFLK